MKGVKQRERKECKNLETKNKNRNSKKGKKQNI